jgi:acetyl-CoA synthetase
MAAADGLFLLYTSGATGRPKQVRHGIGGYLLQAMCSCRQVFSLDDDDIFWCTADLGWVTGHTYSVYGPLGLGGTVLLYEGVPLYPTAFRFWQIVEKFRVSKLYTAPAVIRALMRDDPARTADLSSLRLIASVGEPVDPGASSWYARLVGENRVPVIDTWCQTETGGIIIAPQPSGEIPIPGTVGRPLPGIVTAIVDSDGREAAVNSCGRLVIRQPWPGMALAVSGPGQTSPFYSAEGYDTGDLAQQDDTGLITILGRHADLINVDGHQLGTAEIEATLLSHPAVLEAAVVGIPDSQRGQVVHAFVTLRREIPETSRLLAELRGHVERLLGPIALPEEIQCVPSLPKTKSGKIVRRLLKKIAGGEVGDLGDLSALADPSVLTAIVEEKRRGVGRIRLNL